MKKYIKKTLSILLVATSFTFLYTTLGTSNVLTYANTKVESEVKIETEQKQDSKETTVESDTEQDAEEATAKDNTEQAQEKTATENGTEQREDIEIITSKISPSKKFVHYKGTPFYFDESLKDAYNHSKEELDKIYNDAKDKIKSNLDLDYPDNLEVPIFVHNLIYGDWLGQHCYYYHCYYSYIQILPDYLTDKEVLPHEMTHALLYHILGRNTYRLLNLGLNEGFATQNDSLDRRSVELPKQNKCFATSYPADRTERCIYYKLHQHMILDWIKENGKGVVKKFLEKVKKGEYSVQAFLDLGGDKIVEKYNGTIETSKFKESFYKFIYSPVRANITFSVVCAVLETIFVSALYIKCGYPVDVAVSSGAITGVISGVLCEVTCGVLSWIIG